MRSVEILIGRLVVHGSEPFDAGAFKEALEQQVADQVSRGERAHGSPAGPAALAKRGPASAATQVARNLAERMNDTRSPGRMPVTSSGRNESASR